MAKLIISKKLRASSIIETTTAMVLSGIIFIIAITIYLNIASSDLNFQNIKYQARLRSIASEAVRENDFSSEHISEENIIIEKEAVLHDLNPSLLILRLTAINNGKKIAEYKTMIYAPEN